MTTVQALLARAASAAGKKTIYKLGSGGMDANAPRPSNIRNECDCSGYVCWCLGISRKTDHPLYMSFNGGWINTDAMVHDAKTSTGFFDRIDKPKPGCLIVYPKSARPKIGHVGIVTRLNTDGTVARVLHCSSGASRQGDAVAETAPTVFNTPLTIFAWYAGVEV